MLKRFIGAHWVQVTLGALGAWYLRLVFRTSRFVVEPTDIYERIDRNLPVILTFWHGQHFLTPFIRKPYHKARVLISRHRDGEINAQAAQRLGVGTIRGSGDTKGRFYKKGGPSAFRAMLATLADGENVALTADVPKISRRVGLGIVKLAQQSGRPIVPVAIATSRRWQSKSWDKAAINLPFSRAAAVAADSIRVPADADREEQERFRVELEAALNACTARAYEIVDTPGSAGGPPP
jgi:lysophospholipid acyltransferase (LPLAT)-like uncharacterized protein